MTYMYCEIITTVILVNNYQLVQIQKEKNYIHIDIYRDIQRDIYQNFFIGPSVNGHRLFPVLVIVNNAAMNTKVQISLEHSVLVSFEYSLGGGILDHMVVLFLTL